MLLLPIHDNLLYLKTYYILLYRKTQGLAIGFHLALNSYYRISTGPLEGTNNKIKTMKRQAYGFRDMEFFKLKILGLHETKYALVG